MADLLEQEIDAAEARGRELLEQTPIAQAASFDSVRHRIVVELNDGRAYAFPPRLVEDLAEADASDLAAIVVDGAGLNLHWPKLDVDLFVPDLIAGVFGTKAWLERRGPVATLKASA
jgi:hypothetical protein